MKPTQLRNKIFVLAFLILSVATFAQQPNPPGQVVNSNDAINQAYPIGRAHV